MTASQDIDYEALAQDAMRSVVRSVLTRVAKTGLPGEHHFYIAFNTQAPGRRHLQTPEGKVSRGDDDRAAAPLLGPPRLRGTVRGEADVRQHSRTARRPFQRRQGLLRSERSLRPAVRGIRTQRPKPRAASVARPVPRRCPICRRDWRATMVAARRAGLGQTGWTSAASVPARRSRTRWSRQDQGRS